MVYYLCPRCHYNTLKKTDMVRHLSRKKECDAIFEEIPISECFNKILNKNIKTSHKCEYCKKVFDRKTRLENHKQKCNNKNEFELLKEKLKENEEKLKEKLKEKEEKLKENEEKLKENDKRFDILEQKILEKTKEIEKNNIKYSNNDHFIYILREREFIKSEENIFKIGKTTKPKDRLSDYPRGSKIHLLIECENCHETEKEILQKFEKEFIKRKDIGNEYFEGDIKTMIKKAIILIF